MILQNLKKTYAYINGNAQITAMNGSPGTSDGIMVIAALFKNKRGYVAIGTGTTPATEDDYTLESIADLKIVTNTGTDGSGNYNGYSRIGTVSTNYINETEETVVIREVGIAADYANVKYLFTRDILAEPVTIHPGESYTFTATLDI